jgi:hypothetical protein
MIDSAAASVAAFFFALNPFLQLRPPSSHTWLRPGRSTQFRAEIQLFPRAEWLPGKSLSSTNRRPGGDLSNAPKVRKRPW